jgi:hypothetical protein
VVSTSVMVLSASVLQISRIEGGSGVFGSHATSPRPYPSLFVEVLSMLCFEVLRAL